jgi:O-antigen/teichoic acid export membrane protein
MTTDGSAHRRGLGFAGASFLTTAIVATASAVVTSRIYGVGVIGEFALVSAPYITVSRLSSTGEQTAMINRLAVLGRRNELGSSIFASVLGFSYLITGAIAGLVTFGSVLLLRGPVEHPELVGPAITMVAVYVAAENLSWNLDATFAALNGAADMFVARAIQLLAFLIGAIALGANDNVVNSLVLAHVISILLAMTWRILRAHRYLSWPTRTSLPQGFRELPAILRFGLRLIPGALANGFASQAAIWIIGATQSPALVGAYSRASTLSIRLEEAGFRAIEITYPELVRSHDERDGERFNAVLHQALRPMLLGLSLFVAVVAGASHGIMEVFGDGFDEAAPALALLVLAVSLYACAIIVSSMLPAMDRPGLAARITVIRSLTLIGALFPAAAMGGITAAAAVTALWAGLGLIAHWMISRRVAATHGYVIERPWRYRLLLPMAACTAVARVIDSSGSGFIRLVFASAAATMVFVMIAVMVREIPREWVIKVRGMLTRSAGPTDS